VCKVYRKMKTTLIILLLGIQGALAQDFQNSYTLRWKVTDSLMYRVAFDQIEKVDENEDKSDTVSMKYRLKQILKTIAENFKDYKMESSINRKGELYNVIFYFGGFPILKGDIDDSGNLLTKAEGTSGNFFKIFYDLPDQSIKVGDKWQSNLKIQKKFRGLTLTDSLKTDEVVFRDLKIIDGDQLAFLCFELNEKYLGGHKDEQGTLQNAKIEFIFKTEGVFNITKGKWMKLDGVAIMEFRVPKVTRTVMKIGLIEKEI